MTAVAENTAEVEVKERTIPWLSFELDEEFFNKYRKIPAPFGGNGLGAATFYRTYSRSDNWRLPLVPACQEYVDGGPECECVAKWGMLIEDPREHEHYMESWADTCRRVIEGMTTIEREWCIEHGIEWNEVKGQRSAQEAFDLVFWIKWTPPGRGLEMMGTSLVHRDGIVECLQNCAFTSTAFMRGDPAEPFRWLMEMSMLGVGVGFDTRGAGTVRIHRPRGPEEVFMIPDNREGWAQSLYVLISSYTSIDRNPVVFDASLVRPAGMPIRRFGGVASGPDSLLKMLNQVKEILDQNIGGLFTSRMITDIMNLVGVCVISGNVRRSAEIAFGFPEDTDFVNLKNWDLEENKRRLGADGDPENSGWGWISNNSIFVKPTGDPEYYLPFAEQTHKTGEPGYIWLDNIHNYARMNKIIDTSDRQVLGGNPCFTGDTLVWTINGPRRFDEIVGKKVRVLTETDNGKMVYREMRHIRKTRERARIYRVNIRASFGNNLVKEISSFRATGDHKIFLSDRSEVAVKDLVEGMSLASVYRRKANSKGYLKLTNGVESDMEHRIVEADAHGDVRANYPDWHVDHIDENKRNNTPKNLRRLRRQAHNALNMVDDKNPMRRYPESHGKTLWDITDDRVKELKESGLNYHQIAEELGCSYSTVRRRLGKMKDGRVLVNHEVESVEFVGYEDVYDGEVEETHRFFIVTETGINGQNTGGVLVHNCMEQVLEHKEMCTLGELFISRIKDVNESRLVVKHAYRYCKNVTILNRNIRDAESRAVMTRNSRIGLSSTGIAQFYDRHGRDELLHWFTAMYGHVGYYDRLYSQWLRVNKSIRSTSVKPSGTITLLPGDTTPGIHWSVVGRYYIRRENMPAGSKLALEMMARGYPVEDSAYSPESTWVVSFPIDMGDKVRSEAEVSMDEQIELHKLVTRYWADNNVSQTIKFDKDVVSPQDLAEALAKIDSFTKGVAFVPLNKGVYKQAPYEAITKEEYDELVSRIRVFNPEEQVYGLRQRSDKYCDGDSCSLEVFLSGGW